MVSPPVLDWLPMPPPDWRPRVVALATADINDATWRSAKALAGVRLSFAATNALDAACRRLASVDVRLSILSSSTSAHLAGAIRVAAVRRGFAMNIYEPCYGQYRQDLVDASSTRSIGCLSWEVIERNIPQSAMSHLGAIVTLRLVGYLEEAELAAASAIGRYPTDIHLLFERALIAQARDRWSEAVERWGVAAGVSPSHPGAAASLGAALQRVGQMDEAESILNAAMQKFAVGPHSLTDGWVREIAIQRAKCAVARRDWAASIERWKGLCDLCPGDATFKDSLRDATMLRDLSASSAPEELPDRRSDPSAHDLPAEMATVFDMPAIVGGNVGDRMLMFESLGDSCEFGLVQRHFGVEPLGLLRWTSIRALEVTKLLSSSFAGLGHPDRTTLSVTSEGEYITSDADTGMRMHTFIQHAGQDEGRVLQRMHQRAEFLREKLLSDLIDSHKIFVYRSSIIIAQEEAALLSQALRVYNERNRLLWVNIPDECHPTGTLIHCDDRLSIAYLPCGRRADSPEHWNIDFDGWKSVCGVAARTDGRRRVDRLIGASPSDLYPCESPSSRLGTDVSGPHLLLHRGLGPNAEGGKIAMPAMDVEGQSLSEPTWIALGGASQYARTPPDLYNFRCMDADLKRRLLTEWSRHHVEVPPLGLHVLDDAQVSDLTFVYRHDSSLFPLSAQDHGRLFTIDEIRSFQDGATPELDGEASFIFKAGKNNFGHLLVEMLPKLESLKTAGLNDLPLLVPILPPALDAILTFVLDEIYGGWPVIRLRTPLIRVKRLVYPSPVTRHNDRKSSQVSRFADRVLSAVASSSDSPAGRKLYLSRRKCGNRVLLNEEEVEGIFARHGFAIFHPEDHTFADQVRVFSQAACVAGPVGAALTSIMFAPAAAHVLVLDPGTHDIFFFDLACLKGQSFSWLFAADLEPPSVAALHGSWSIRPELVESALCSLGP